MKVEVGDWVRMRGKVRIEEVCAVEQRGEEVIIKTIGGLQHGSKASNIEAVAPKFWIRKGEP